VIYPIADSEWDSPIYVVPKKGGTIVLQNKEGELVPIRVQSGWRVCIEYRKLNKASKRDHFPFPFIDQMLKRLAGRSHYYFLDGYSGYIQVPITPEDQENATFTYPFGTYDFRRMPFGLSNAPTTFQRCMMSIFSDFITEIMEVFMDDFTVNGDSFDECLHHLTLVLRHCIDINLMLNFKKCHFMVEHRPVLGHVVSLKGLEIDKAKVDIIQSLPHPRYVKDVRSFLGYVGFYRRFIKDFSKIASPLCAFLAKDASFDFSDDCMRAFDQLKLKLTTSSIV